MCKLAGLARLLVAVVLTAAPANAAPVTLACTAWGGSHTSRYTFDIDSETCTVYWREIGRDLELANCAPPHIEAVKPFAPAAGYLLRFNLVTGAFSDHVPGWAERGECVSAE